MSKSTPVLKLKNINKSFTQGINDIVVLKDISLEIGKGETVSIVGPSGCGKSTLLHIAGLLDDPDTGDVLIGNKIISNKTDKIKNSIRNSKIGFVYQHHHLLGEFTAIENIAMPLIIAGKTIDHAEKQALKLLKKLGLEDRKDHLPSQLSGGEQQRVAIARAVANKPAILFADEPTGNLDPENSKTVLKLFLQLVKDMNMSLLLVTHDKSIAAKTSKRLIFKGKKLVKA